MRSKETIFERQNFSFKTFIMGNHSENGIKKKRKSIVQRWRETLDKRGVKQIWLADQTDLSPEHISNILAERVLLTDENRNKINKALGTDFK